MSSLEAAFWQLAVFPELLRGRGATDAAGCACLQLLSVTALLQLLHKHLEKKQSSSELRGSSEGVRGRARAVGQRRGKPTPMRPITMHPEEHPGVGHCHCAVSSPGAEPAGNRRLPVPHWCWQRGTGPALSAA